MLDALFSDGKYDIPIVFEKDDMKGGISSLLGSYIKDLKTVGASPGVVGRVQSFRKSCAAVLRNYLRGIHSRAYVNFTNAVSRLGIDNSPLLSAPLEDKWFFRGRINTSNEDDFSEREMFHIPPDKRGIVTSQRYSFPGLPCLYLGSSAYTCWMEMGRPQFDVFQVALLRLRDEKAKIIDLSRIPQQLHTFKDREWFSEDEYLLYWPLLAVCSIKARHEEDAFKPEYIFPQFFLEYIQKNSNKHVGIRYASIKCERQLRDDRRTFTNYVFPTSTGNMTDDTDAKLSSLFEFYCNRSGSELSILTPMLGREGVKTRDEDEESPQDVYATDIRKGMLYTSDGKEYPYSLSQFGLIELALRCRDYHFDEDGVRVGGLGGLGIADVINAL